VKSDHFSQNNQLKDQKKIMENRINMDIIKINCMDVLLMEIAQVQELALNIQILLSQIWLVG
jgi:hypothetical protein